MQPDREVQFSEVWKAKSLDKELTHALTAGKGAIPVQF
jgi:hypothetical protein